MRVSPIPITVLLVLLLAALTPAAQATTFARPLGLLPDEDTTRFEWDSMPAISAALECRTEAQNFHNGESVKYIATNAPEDVCRSHGSEGAMDDGRLSQTSTADSQTLHMFPAFNNTKAKAGESITGKLWMVTNGRGWLEPTVTLTIGNFEASWSGARVEHPTTDTDSEMWYTWDMDFGTAPELLTGKGKIVIAAPIGVDAAGPGVNAKRAPVSEWGFGIDNKDGIDHQTWIDIPFAAADPVVEDPIEECPEETEDADNSTSVSADCAVDTVEESVNETTTNANATANETLDDPADGVDHEGHDANNTTADPTVGDEEGLPGFQVVAVLAAGAIALVGLGRGRRPESLGIA